jgi:hypothetical protein
MATSADECSFCHKSRDQVRLIAGATVLICVECIALCNEIVADEAVKSALEADPALPVDLQNEIFYSLTSAVLDTLALGGEPQPYSAVAPIVGYHHRSRKFFEQLGRSLREDAAAEKPLRASLVINKKSGMPGQSYFEVCRSLGHDIPLGKEAEFWGKQLEAFPILYSE